MLFAVTVDSTLPARSPGLGGAMRLLSDPTRLRILALLEREELAVGELSRSLDLTQSRVSNHLRLLRDAGLLLERKEGTKTFLRLDRPQNGERSGVPAARLWSVLREELDELPEHGADRVRLEGVLAARESDGSFFDRLAGEWDKFAGAFETGRARERAAVHLLPREFVVADLGCGTGYMGEALLENVSRLISVDRSEAMLAEAKERLTRRANGRTELEFRNGRLDALPIADDELDALVAGMVLHHLDSLDDAVAEMRRVLKPGGTASVLELAPHREAWMRDELGDRHLGVAPKEILAAFERAGFEDLALDPVEDQYRPRRAGSTRDDVPPSLSLYVVRGRRPRARNTSNDR